MPTITVKRGIQFHPELYSKPNRTEWLTAVGKELETKGLTIKVGEGANAKEVKNAAQLVAAMKDLEVAARAAGSTVQVYVVDLLQAIDDVVRPEAKVTTGDTFDFSRGSALAKALGVDDARRANYGSMSTTDFGVAAASKPEATMKVGDVTLQLRAPMDLTNVPHMSAESLRNAPASYGRDGEEVEDTRVITGLTKEQTVGLANTSLNDLQRPRAAAGLTLGQVPLDEMNWDSEAHALRRANPYVSFTLDSRSFEVNPNSGQPRVAVGRDFFFDTFMAKKDLKTGQLTRDLQKADLMYRARIRYGNDRDPFEGTRVLIGMKEGTAIDASGTKHARKIDSRTDSANQQIFDSLISSAQTGKLGQSWGSWASGQVPPAAAAMYRTAVLKGITNDIGGETNVLALEPGAVARQIRGRFHLDETNQSSLVQGFKDAGEPKIAELAALITAAPDWAANGASPSKAQLLAQANALTDRSAIVAAATEGLKKLDPTLTVDKALIDKLWPGQPITTKADAKAQRVVADAIRSTYDAFSQNIDDLQRNIGGTTDSAVRDVANPSDVEAFFRQKAAVARFMAHCDSDATTSGVTAGNAATYTAYAKKVLAMPDGKDKTKLLQSIAIGSDQLSAMTDAAFASPVKVSPTLVKKQTVAPFIAELDAQLAGAQKDAFTTELAAYLASKNSPALQSAADKSKVLGDLRKGLVTDHVEVLHRMVEGAGSWGQAVWFNTYRQTMLGINPQSWNFIIGSMDYTEFYDAKTGLNMEFKDRVSRKPLDASKMSGAMISNDIQIELEAEEGYTRAIRTAQYAVNSATAGLLMDYALSKNLPGLTSGDAAAFEKWLAGQAALPSSARKAFLDDVAAYAKQKGSAIDVAKTFAPLVEQQQAIAVLVGFATQKNPTLNVADRAAVEAWYREQGNQGEEKLNDFLTELARYGASVRSELPLSPNLLKTLDFKPFAATNVGQPVTGHAQLADDLATAQEVWTMVKKAQQDLSIARGAEVQKVLKANDLKNKGWEPPSKAKGDYAIDAVLQ